VAHTSAILAASLSWNDAAIAALHPRRQRVYVQQESMAWQQLSQNGADAESFAMPSPWRRTFELNGTSIAVPKRGKRLPPSNRLLEIHGLAGAIGEQLGLAWTAEQDVQRFVATREGRTPEHQRLMQRALAELGGHFVLGGAHSLANFTLRVLLLNKPAAAHLCASYPKANGFAPGTDVRTVWPTLNGFMVKQLVAAAAQSDNRFMVAAVSALTRLYQGTPFTALDQRRGLDYHRRRPQSLEHASPRKNIVEHDTTVTTVTMPGPALEMEADADAVHEIVVDALVALRLAMREIRCILARAIRREGITYVFR